MFGKEYKITGHCFTNTESMIYQYGKYDLCMRHDESMIYQYGKYDLCMRHDGSLSHKVALQNFIRMLFYKLNVDL